MKIPQTLLFCVAATVCRSRVIHHGRVATPVTFGRIRIFLDAQMLAANATDLETLAIHAETTTRDSPRRVRQLASELKSKALTAALGLRKRGDDLTDILFRNTTTPTSLVRVTRAVPAMAIGAGIGIGIGLAAIGFATANRVAIANLEQKMAAQDERIDDLITTVKARNIMIDNDIKALNQTMGALAEAMDEREGIRLLDEMRTTPSSARSVRTTPPNRRCTGQGESDRGFPWRPAATLTHRRLHSSRWAERSRLRNR